MLLARPPTRRSALFGHFRLFVLNSGRVFLRLRGDPEGAAPPPRPARPRVPRARAPPLAGWLHNVASAQLPCTENGQRAQGIGTAQTGRTSTKGTS